LYEINEVPNVPTRDGNLGSNEKQTEILSELLQKEHKID